MSDQLGTRFAPMPIDSAAVESWMAKARTASVPLVAAAGAAGAPAPVLPRRVDGLGEAEFGNFMLCWPDDQGEQRVIHHLPDAGFFVELLRRCYAPVLAVRPELAGLLTDGSRLEVAFTNDVLQAQLRGDWQPYSMIRHHALMLFHGMLWLDEPARSGWFALCEALADHATATGGVVPVERLADVEAAAFADFVRLAPRTHDPADAAELLAEPGEWTAVAEYQVLAAVAVAVLWRDYQAQPPQERAAWQRRELADGYGRQDYLTRRWARLLSPGDGEGGAVT